MLFHENLAALFNGHSLRVRGGVFSDKNGSFNDMQLAISKLLYSLQPELKEV
jgi:hypothetical protein